MVAAGITALQVLTCLGLGALVLRLTGICDRLSTGERYSWSFAIGFGALGWLLFFVGTPGALSGSVLLVVLAVPVPAVLLLRPASLPRHMAGDIGRTSRLVLVAVILIVLMDAFEIPAPITDADSIAYHYDLPRRFWEAGAIYFIPRALDGAVPLLVHMTYIAPYAFGGETGLNLWAMLTGLAAGLLVYTTCRRYLSPSWSFAVWAVFASTPAVLYGAGSGQVEIRLALFAIVAAVAAGEALRRDDPGFAIVAGLAAGFFAGGKYFGLMFAAATGLALLWKRGFLKRGTIYSAAAVVAGFQWYWWNWLHTGDPVFPMLFPLLGDAGTGYWSDANHRVLLDWLSTVDRPVPADLLWFFLYPFSATLRSFEAFEATRTGVGPIVLLLLPFALAGAWHYRRSIRTGPMTAAVTVVVAGYALWFFMASSQRVRYLLPIYSILVVVVSVAAVRFGERTRLVRPLAAAFAVTCVIQLAGQALFSAPYVRFALTGQEREAFYDQRVSRYALVRWINTHLDRDDVVMTTYRDIVFLLDPRVFQTHPFDQALVDVLPDSDDPRRFVRQLRAVGVTHAVADLTVAGGYGASYSRLMSAALEAGCFGLVDEVQAAARSSRTLPALSERTETIGIFRRTDESCPW